MGRVLGFGTGEEIEQTVEEHSLLSSEFSALSAITTTEPLGTKYVLESIQRVIPRSTIKDLKYRTFD